MCIHVFLYKNYGVEVIFDTLLSNHNIILWSTFCIHCSTLFVIACLSIRTSTNKAHVFPKTPIRGHEI